MRIKHHYIVADTREQFKNELDNTSRPYNDHPSLESINYIVAELSKAGFQTVFWGGLEDLIEAYHQKKQFSNRLFLNFSDGLSQFSRKAQTAIMLELLNVPYAGSDPLASLMAGNKAYTKKMISERLDVPKGITIYRSHLERINIRYPVVIKPNREVSPPGHPVGKTPV